MIIYAQETDDGLAEKISGSTCISYASIATPCDISQNIKPKISNKIYASIDDSDLYYIQSILVSSSWNRNDDIFDKYEVWSARKTPEDKPTNLEHDENTIIGHITSNWPIDEDGNILDENLNASELPDKFHIVTGSVIYKAFSSPELRERSEKLIAEIESGKKYVSMECYFKGFDYGLINKSTGEYKVLSRNDNTSYLTKYLRAYGGQGEHEDYKIGRVLRNITFSGKGFVDKPANPDSIIFNKSIINDLMQKKNDNLLKSGVIEIKPIVTADTENITMNMNDDTTVVISNELLETVAANCADTSTEAQSVASELQKTNQTLEAAMKETEEKLAQANEAIEAIKSDAEKTLAEKELEFEEAAKKWKDEKAMMDEEMKKVKSELDAANEVIAGYKMKEEEMARKDKMMKRKATLVEAGLEDDAASAAVEKFENLDDQSFEAVTSLLAAMKPPKKKEGEAVMKKMMAAEDNVEAAESALEEVEAEQTVDLSVGGDESETESAEASIRSELVEFVSARLGKTSK
jgi:hypothetical protein